MPFDILGMGTAVPDVKLNQKEALRAAEILCARTPENLTWLPAMYNGTGIESRYICIGREVVDDILNETQHSGSPFLPNGTPDDAGPLTKFRMQVFHEEAGKIALESTKKALANSETDAKDITHLITVSCTGFSAPGYDYHLIQELNLPRNVLRTNVGFMGCHGSFNALRVAQAYAESDPSARILLCSVELCSIHYHYGWDPQKIIANALFSDGSGALVGRAAPSSGSDRWKLHATGSILLDNSARAMSWHVANHGFDMVLSKKIPELIQAHLREPLTNWLAKYEVDVKDVGTWAVHPGGPKILEAVGSAMSLTMDRFWASKDILRDYGNMSSATILFILNHLRKQRSPGPVVAIGFGPGLTMEMMLFK
ncbi:MAG: type III polyketide synthase [Zavarzinella sp.]